MTVCVVCIRPGVLLLVTSLVYLKLVCFHGVSLTYTFSLFTALCLPAAALMLLQPQCSLERSTQFDQFYQKCAFKVTVLFSAAKFLCEGCTNFVKL